MNKEEKAFHYLLEDYMRIPKTWEDYQIIKNAIAENKQLKDNWNKLKEYCKNNYYGTTTIGILDKMQEIEGGMNE